MHDNEFYFIYMFPDTLCKGIVFHIDRNSDFVYRYGAGIKKGAKESTLIAIRYSPYLRNFYDRLKAKKGSGKAIIATSRKLLTIVYRTLKYDWVFEDFSKFKIAATT